MQTLSLQIVALLQQSEDLSLARPVLSDFAILGYLFQPYSRRPAFAPLSTRTTGSLGIARFGGIARLDCRGGNGGKPLTSSASSSPLGKNRERLGASPLVGAQAKVSHEPHSPCKNLSLSWLGGNHIANGWFCLFFATRWFTAR